MRRRVLVIDDHLPSKSFLIKALNEKGFEVIGEGTSGKGALRLAQAVLPEVILMAVGLCDIDGISAAREIMQVVGSKRCDTIEASRDPVEDSSPIDSLSPD